MSFGKETVGLNEVQMTDNSWNVVQGITRVSVDFPNMYVVEGNKACALIDSGWGDKEEVDAIGDQINSTKLPLGAIVITHKHPDHEGGVPKLRELYPGIPVVGINRREFDGWKKIDLGGRRLTVIGAPGHTADSKYVFDSETRALFTGDNVLGDLTADIEFMGEYMDGLGSLVSLQPNVICPGHYEAIYGATSAVQEVLRHRQEREAQVLGSLSRRSSTLDQLFDRIYGEAYKSKRTFATLQIVAHLVKLLEEGKVQQTKKGWVLTS
jgi:glyoxylase-like metal-dependent hydrolase (beta-lactamase superfamily II)